MDENSQIPNQKKIMEMLVRIIKFKLKISINQ